MQKASKRKWFNITKIRSNHGDEFENLAFKSYCEENSIKHEILSTYNTTPKWDSRKKE